MKTLESTLWLVVGVGCLVTMFSALLPLPARLFGLGTGLVLAIGAWWLRAKVTGGKQQ